MSHDFPIIIADESVESRIIRGLILCAYDVYSIINEKQGISDKQVIDIAIEKNGYIITEDKDFGDELVYNNCRPYKIGARLLRIFDLPVDVKVKLVIYTLSAYHESLKNNFAVLTAKKLRIRRYSI